MKDGMKEEKFMHELTCRGVWNGGECQVISRPAGAKLYVFGFKSRFPILSIGCLQISSQRLASS